MQIDWWTLGLQAINALVLIWILGRFLFRPITRIITERQVAATEQLDAAQVARAQADAALAEAKNEARKLTADRGQVMADAVAEATREKAALLAQARDESQSLRSAAEADLARVRAADAQAAADRASALAVDIAAHVLDRLPPSSRITGFVDGLAEAVAGLPEATQASIGSDGPVRLKTARALTQDEDALCRDALEKVLGRPVTIVAEIDPSLLAGLELDAPHAIVRNNLRADLGRIAKELTRHDR